MAPLLSTSIILNISSTSSWVISADCLFSTRTQPTLSSCSMMSWNDLIIIWSKVWSWQDEPQILRSPAPPFLWGRTGPTDASPPEFPGPGSELWGREQLPSDKFLHPSPDLFLWTTPDQDQDIYIIHYTIIHRKIKSFYLYLFHTKLFRSWTCQPFFSRWIIIYSLFITLNCENY